MIISFGKHRGKSISELVLLDKQYSNWLLTQPWFCIKHKELKSSLTEELNKIKINKPSNNSFIIYTDGACKNNGSVKAKSGIGVHFSHRNKININDISEKVITDKHTNNKAELKAILRALELCYNNSINEKIIIYTDSDYSIKCITLWYPEWITQNRIENRKNIEILHEINNYYSKLDVEFIHIRSHTGLKDEHSLGNEIADNLAQRCI